MNKNEAPVCKKCSTVMKRGTALVQGFKQGLPDFGDDDDSRGQTMVPDAKKTVPVSVWKCPDCGYTHT